MNLPQENALSTNLLAACFNKKSSTYKYYWLLSIVQELEKNGSCILKRNLFARMISNAWYTVNYFHVSFGKQDLIQTTIKLINEAENIPIDEKLDSVFNLLINTNNKETEKQLWHFNKNVPHWFLSPWFPSLNKAEIYKNSKNYSKNCLYALYDDYIEINLDWVSYLITNSRLLKDFCYWNLSLFLQTKNPNVPDIPNKLIKPVTRKNLTKQRKQFWDIVLRELGTVDCIYTGDRLSIDNYALEHFVPYSFVSHDLIWNLIPADISFNSSKSDKLPSLDKYFIPFYKLQKQAFDIVQYKTPNNKFLQDYLTIFPIVDNNFTEEKFRETIQPLITIASNNGFEFLK